MQVLLVMWSLLLLKEPGSGRHTDGVWGREFPVVVWAMLVREQQESCQRGVSTMAT